MEHERTVTRRLDRIDRLQREGAPAADLLDEVRRLLHAAERLAAGGGNSELEIALEHCREALAEGELPQPQRHPEHDPPAGAVVHRSP
jgi:hypothetical protein